MAGKVPKETHWGTAFKAAEQHPDGELVNVHGATLRAMERADAAYRRDGKWYMEGKGPGPVEEPVIEEAAPEQKTVGMDAEMRAAFERAVHAPTGYFHDVPDVVMARLADMGVAGRDVDDEDYSLTDKGWELGSLPDHVSPSGIRYRVANTARWEIPIELVDPAPDTQAPGFPMVRPKSVTIALTPNRAGVWCVSSAAVWGPKVKDGKVATQRDYSTLFSDLMDALSETPDWLKELCQEWADRANGWASLAAEPKKTTLTVEERIARLEKLAGVEN
jgi:hypothetical protein